LQKGHIAWSRLVHLSANRLERQFSSSSPIPVELLLENIPIIREFRSQLQNPLPNLLPNQNESKNIAATQISRTSQQFPGLF